jgi:ribose 5-phosphate isomerase B
MKEQPIIFGASGQGEAIMANRFKGVRSTVYYGQPQSGKCRFFNFGKKNNDIIRLAREHNNSNVLSIGALFVGAEETKEVIKQWLSTPFSNEERHIRRNHDLDNLN